MRWILAVGLILLILLVPSLESQPNPGSPWLGQIQASYHREKTVDASIFCLHQRTIQSYIDLFEVTQTQESAKPYMAKDVASGECIVFPESANIPIDEYGEGSGVPVINEKMMRGNAFYMEPVRVRKYWTILMYPAYHT